MQMDCDIKKLQKIAFHLANHCFLVLNADEGRHRFSLAINLLQLISLIFLTFKNIIDAKQIAFFIPKFGLKNFFL
jgi:hypothetical protein